MKKKQSLIILYEEIINYFSMKTKLEIYVVKYIKSSSFYYFFEYLNTKEELDTFITNPKNKIIELYKLEYIKNFALKQDVIKKTNFDGKEKYLTAIDRYGYAIYNPERSKKSNKFIWEYQYGSLKDIYEEFRNRGITFENNVYLKLEEEDKELDRLIKKRINSKLKQKNK